MSKINENIKGFELIKDCVDAYGVERCPYEYLFAVKRNNNGDYLSAIVEVCPRNSYEDYKEMEEKYPFEDYIIWGGTIYESKRRGKVIEFYWS